MALNVGPDLERRLREAAARHGQPVDEYVRPALEGLAIDTPSVSPPAELTASPIWQTITDSADELSPDDLSRLPSDLASQHDHYIYGTAKRP